MAINIVHIGTFLIKYMLIQFIENIKNYKIVQDQLSRQAEKFSNKWKEVLLENPELDYSLIHPTNNAGRILDAILYLSK